MTDVLKAALQVVGGFFVAYMIGYASFLFLSVTVGSSALYGAKRRNALKNELRGEYYVPVSIIVPAHNESVTIESTVRSLLALDYRTYEIIVVDDGSTDDTAQILRDAFHMFRINRPIQRRLRCQQVEAVYETRAWKTPITLIQKRNGGKADALNMGINASRYPYFLCMDADSVLQRDSLEKIVRPVLEDDRVVAVGGAVRPCNGAEIEDGAVVRYRMPNKLLPCMQVLEYDRSFLAARILFDKFNGSIIISGAFGLFKKSVVVDAGGYDTTTMGEDMELVMKLHVFCREHGMPYLIRYATDAICWTQAPEKLSDLCKQRRRWHIGLFQSMTRHRRILSDPKYGMVGLVSYIYFLIYELFSPYIEVAGMVTTALAMALGVLNVSFMVLYMGIYVAYSSILSLTAFFARVHTIDLKLTFSDVCKAVGLCLLEVSCLRFVLAWVRVTALGGGKKRKRGWGEIERKQIHFSTTGAKQEQPRMKFSTTGASACGGGGTRRPAGCHIRRNALAGKEICTMRLDELKKGLWGYKKEGVYRYIMNLEEESSQKLAEKDEKMAQQEAQAQSRIGELERTVEALREENTSLKANQSAVFATLLEAQRYAERLREESARREQKAQEELKTKICRQTQMLERYSDRVRQLREVLRDMLVEFDGKAEQTGQALASIQEQDPLSGSLPKRPDQDAQESDTWKKLLSM